MVAGTSIMDCAAQIRALAGRREYAEAVRYFEVLVHRRAPCTRHDTAAELARVGGAEVAKALAKAFARAPCYLCSSGRIICDSCNGARTVAANGRFCENCGGHGRVQCLFCGGSGFLPIEGVPFTLQRAVARRRLEWAAGSLRKVSRSVKDLPHDKRGTGFLRSLLALFHGVQRIEASLENSPPPTPDHKTNPDSGSLVSPEARLIKECRRLSTKYRRQLTKAIVAVCHRQARREEAGTPRHTAWERQAQFFEAQADAETD
jgi:hypothetical protein